MADIRILREGSRAESKVTALDFRRTGFGILRNLFESHVTNPGGKSSPRKVVDI